MKKVFFLVFFLLSGCSFIISLHPSYSHEFRHGERFWVKKGTKEQVSEDTYIDCFNSGFQSDLNQKGFTLDSYNKGLTLGLYKWDEYNISLYQGKCLHDLGYVFKEDIFSKYCYHYSNEVECKAFRKYKN
ncbi:hypothetical protein P9079_10680 [Gallibacterium anatis]|uniref:hypothetical protein n=1 Tax=Gallibacterium anatis TaxID=750 RepID=UPI0005314EEF|nr:hypothetical protein [Gallibacterium anatis]KGQ23554.1 hypothetical protein JP31_10250 [Gallibacterium anatis]KGQ29268.1 hypothetical protein JP27_01250 [Gallibacterium anatis]